MQGSGGGLQPDTAGLALLQKSALVMHHAARRSFTDNAGLAHRTPPHIVAARLAAEARVPSAPLHGWHCYERHEAANAHTHLRSEAMV